MRVLDTKSEKKSKRPGMAQESLRKEENSRLTKGVTYA